MDVVQQHSFAKIQKHHSKVNPELLASLYPAPAHLDQAKEPSIRLMFDAEITVLSS